MESKLKIIKRCYSITYYYFSLISWLLLLLPCLFKVRPFVLSKTLSQIWDRLNLPILLFKVGLLTLIKMDSLIFLAKLCPSLPIIWKLLWLVGWPVWLL